MEKKTPVITEEKIDVIADKKFLRMYDCRYAEGRHYFIVSRRKKEDLWAVKSEEEGKNALPDAVSCFVIVLLPDNKPRLLLSREYRYPLGRFVLSVPAGLMDEQDRMEENPLRAAAAREIREETGLAVADTDTVFAVSPCCFSTPGMTDESNALVCAVVRAEDDSFLTDSNSEETELFDGFILADREEAERYLSAGRDRDGVFYSMHTFAALLYFVSGRWEEDMHNL